MGQWEGIDDLILRWQLIQALQLIREREQVTLHQAIELLDGRAQWLREHRPEDCKPRPEGYEFYS